MCTVPFGNDGTAARNKNAAWAVSNLATEWVMSMTSAPGMRLQMLPFNMPTYTLS